jgi:iron complex transport system permease protein
VALAFPFVLLLAALPFLARGLNALAIGEAEAFYLGIPVQRLKIAVIVLVALATGASVAAAGIIGFVGIVVPQLLRLIQGPEHRLLLPACVFLGGLLLLGADTCARTIVAPAELPIGILTAGIGAPFFLWILLRRRQGFDG